MGTWRQGDMAILRHHGGHTLGNEDHWTSGCTLQIKIQLCPGVMMAACSGVTVVSGDSVAVTAR